MRLRKPLDVHKLQSTTPQYVEKNSDVPSGRPKYPKGISGEAKRAFKRLVAMLEARKTITAGDQEILRLYAHLFDRHQRALEHIALEGEVVEAEVATKTGEIMTVEKPNLWLRIAETCESKMLAQLTQLGLTPACRNKVSKIEPPQKPVDHFPGREEATAAPDAEVDPLDGIDTAKLTEKIQ